MFVFLASFTDSEHKGNIEQVHLTLSELHLVILKHLSLTIVHYFYMFRNY